jgi:hypothetical protein
MELSSRLAVSLAAKVGCWQCAPKARITCGGKSTQRIVD